MHLYREGLDHTLDTKKSEFSHLAFLLNFRCFCLCVPHYSLHFHGHVIPLLGLKKCNIFLELQVCTKQNVHYCTSGYLHGTLSLFTKEVQRFLQEEKFVISGFPINTTST